MSYDTWVETPVADFVGKTFTKVEQKDVESITFETAEGEVFVMDHSQDCCEQVYIEDVNGDLNDLVGAEIIRAEEVKSGDAEGNTPTNIQNDFEWTFYKFATVKGFVTIRWYGESESYSIAVNLSRRVEAR